MNIELNKIQKLVSEIIERELLIEFEQNFKYMENEQAEKFNDITNKANNLYDDLYNRLDDEEKKLLMEYDDLKEESAIRQVDYYFERGVRCGLSSLDYLKKYFTWF